jgi:hypothetical protein
VPETANRCVRPVVRKSLTSVGSRPASSPSTRAGTSTRRSAGSPAAESRSAWRIRPEARHHGSGPARMSGGWWVDRSAATSPAPAGDSRPDTSTTAPSGVVDHARLPKTTTGSRNVNVVAPDWTRDASTRTMISSAKRPWTIRGSSVTVPTNVTMASERPRALKGLSASRVERTPAEVATAPATSSAARALRPATRPQRRHAAATAPAARAAATGHSVLGARTNNAPDHAATASAGIRRSRLRGSRLRSSGFGDAGAARDTSAQIVT